MDLVNLLFEPLVDFFLKLCAVSFTFGGFRISVGALFIWCAIASTIIIFVKGWSS